MEALTLAAAIFDLDGVVTATARLHAAAWKELFEPLQPFDEVADYLRYVDGKPRREGLRSFLGARGVTLSEAEEAELAARKDALFARRLRAQGVETFPSTVALIEALRARGVKIGMVSSSRHAREVLEAAGLAQLFDACLDGVDLERRGLKGKPDPDMFLSCAEALGVAPARAAVFEDALAGVQAAHRGGFGLVVGIERAGRGEALAHAGADLVVRDLEELDPARLEQALRERRAALAWRVEQEGFDPAREHQMESLFAVGNGYLGVRGALESPLPGAHADLFVAGVYDRKRPERPYSEIEFLAPERGAALHSELVSLPFPFRLRLSLEGEALDFSGSLGRSLTRVLDLARGVLHTEALYESAGGRRTLVRARRCASLEDPHLLLQEVLILPQNHSAGIDCEAALDEPDLAARHPHLERLESRADDALQLARFATIASGIEVCIAARTSVEHAGEGLRLRRFVSVFSSRDGVEPRAAAAAHLEAQRWEAFEARFAAHAARWEAFWTRADVRIEPRPAVEQALRFAAYHLRSAAGEDPRVSVPARGLTGRAYEGHVFWDVEIFMLPFYLHVAPERARTLLLYRHHTLEGARRRARSLGYQGACFAWESTVTGEDATPREIRLQSSGQAIPIFTGTQQVHVTADIAYAVWRYWEATQDEAFLAGAGAELLAESARFWASRVERGARHFHIRGVVGPDEYHHSVDDNAYTNWMARFNLERAAWVTEKLQPRGIGKGEAEAWREVAGALYCPDPNADNVIEQFAGFFDLEDHALAGEARFRAPVHRLFDWERINRLKLIKQADVLMLFFVFPEAFSDAVVAANYRYYEPLTDHASSLSPPVHAAIAARLGLAQEAEAHWRRALYLDLSNAMDNSPLGVHPACMAGTWQALVFGFLGVRCGEDGPRPAARAGARLPAHWRSVALELAWRGRRYPVRVTPPES